MLVPNIILANAHVATLGLYQPVETSQKRGFT
jgi:hypothetical protein